jgi:hypothetical protein
MKSNPSLDFLLSKRGEALDVGQTTRSGKEVIETKHYNQRRYAMPGILPLSLWPLNEFQVDSSNPSLSCFSDSTRPWWWWLRRSLSWHTRHDKSGREYWHTVLT